MRIIKQNNNIRVFLLFFAIMVCAFLLRINNLFKYDLWFDEVFTDSFSSEYIQKYASLTQVTESELFLDKLKQEPPSSLYYLIVNIYTKVFPGGQGLRIISLLFSILSLVVFFKLSRLFVDQYTSLFALLVMAFNAFHIWYSQEARVYSMVCFFSLLFLFFFMKAINNPKKVYWICFILFAIVSLYLSYHTVFLLVCCSCIFVFKDKRKYLSKWMLALLLIVSSLLFIFPILISQLQVVNKSFFVTQMTPLVFAYTWGVFSFGYSASKWQYLFGGMFFCGLAIFGLTRFWISCKKNTICFVLFLVLPILLIALLSVRTIPIYVNRQILFLSPLFYILIARGVTGFRSKLMQGLVGFGVIALLIISDVNYYNGFMEGTPFIARHYGKVLPKKSYNDLLEHMKTNLIKGDVVVTADLLGYGVVLNYLLKDSELYEREFYSDFSFLCFPGLTSSYSERYLDSNTLFSEIPFSDQNKMHEFSPFRNSKAVTPIQLESFENIDRVWLVATSLLRDSFVQGNALGVQEYFDNNFLKINEVSNDGFILALYQKK